jgi:hypothetical protein
VHRREKLPMAAITYCQRLTLNCTS